MKKKLSKTTELFGKDLLAVCKFALQQSLEKNDKQILQILKSGVHPGDLVDSVSDNLFGTMYEDFDNALRIAKEIHKGE